jgi:hypothetical protein
MSDDIELDVDDDEYLWFATMFMAILFVEAMASLGLATLGAVCGMVVFLALMFDLFSI